MSLRKTGTGLVFVTAAGAELVPVLKGNVQPVLAAKRLTGGWMYGQTSMKLHPLTGDKEWGERERLSLRM